MQVHPHCGDGVEISVLYWDSQKVSTEVLHAAEYAVQQAPVRQRVLFFLDHLHTGMLLCHLACMQGLYHRAQVSATNWPMSPAAGAIMQAH